MTLRFYNTELQWIHRSCDAGILGKLRKEIFKINCRDCRYAGHWAYWGRDFEISRGMICFNKHNITQRDTVWPIGLFFFFIQHCDVWVTTRYAGNYLDFAQLEK